jgi:hypothetical protein
MAAAVQERAFGLVQSRSRVPVPVTHVEVTAKLVDFLARVSIRQTYVNRENHPIEALYIFPLDSKGV